MNGVAWVASMPGQLHLPEDFYLGSDFFSASFVMCCTQVLRVSHDCQNILCHSENDTVLQKGLHPI